MPYRRRHTKKKQMVALFAVMMAFSAVGVSSMRELVTRAERWRPWRAYAAMHLLIAENRRARTGSLG